ncbi:MAG TPA: hypothetical protein VHB53_12660 [Solirubrobacterales bacterium]|nr:hypothetical protein [Solirubrobacterales bacterium]
MKVRTLVSTVTASLLAALLPVPGGTAAAAKPASRQTPPSIDQEIVEQGSNGFSVSVSVHDRHRLELSATKSERGLMVETATYEMPLHSPPGSTEIRARLGRLGRIDMRFLPEKIKEVPPSGSACKGGKIVEEEGAWVGLLAFHGERGFTRIRVHSALGTVTKVPPLRCRREKPPNLKKLKRELEALEEQGAGAEEESGAEAEEQPQAFELVATARHHRVALAAARAVLGEGRKRSSISSLVAAGSRRRGRIEETGSVLDILAPGFYLRPANSREPTAETTVKPPAPFSGSATYRTPPKGPPTWTGDLKVELPGFGVVRLAGKGTRAVMCELAMIESCEHDLGGRASSLPLARLGRRP